MRSLLLTLLVSCATVPRQLSQDITLTTPSGATVLAPKGWWVIEGDVIVLEDPYRAVKMALLEMHEPDAEKAIAASWQRLQPGFARRAKRAPISPPPPNGWDAVTEIQYETSTAEHRGVEAIARRHGSTIYVALIDGDTSALSRGAAQLESVLESLRPKGMQVESFAGKTARRIDEARAKELDDFIARAMARLAVPGAAIAIVQGREVTYEKTVGVRELGKSEPVTPSTLFMLASITKPMTTMMEATLVDAGKLAWDTPLVELLPSFALADPSITGKVALWHTSCACTGMPRQDLENIFEFAAVSPEERIASMKTMKPTTGFGETFQYSNLMVAAGGYAAAHAYAPDRPFNDAFAEVMRKNLFEPIGMASTTLDFEVALARDHATPHALAIDGSTRTVPIDAEKNVLNIAPAGAVWTNMRDMERFVLTELGKGVSPDGKRVVSEANLLERRKERVRSGDGGYGLGLGVGSYRDLPSIAHDGGAFGFGTTMFILPQQELAIIILTNVRNGGPHEYLPFNAAVTRRIIELAFEGAKPLAATNLEWFARMKEDAVAPALAKLERDPDPKWIAALAGTYTNASLGAVEIRGAIFDAGEWKSAFGRRSEEDGTAKIVLLDPPFAGSEIVAGNGTLSVEYGQLKYVFERAGK